MSLRDILSWLELILLKYEMWLEPIAEDAALLLVFQISPLDVHILAIPMAIFLVFLFFLYCYLFAYITYKLVASTITNSYKNILFTFSQNYRSHIRVQDQIPYWHQRSILNKIYIIFDKFISFIFYLSGWGLLLIACGIMYIEIFEPLYVNLTQ